METGDRIKERMNTTMTSREDLAKALNVDTVTVWRWIKGERNLKEQTIKDIAKALNTTSAYLMGEIDNPDISFLENIGEKKKETPTHETWKEIYNKLITHNPDLEFWFREENANLSERDYKTLSNIILSFLKSCQEDN